MPYPGEARAIRPCAALEGPRRGPLTAALPAAQLPAPRPLPDPQAGQCGNQIGAKFWEASCSGRGSPGPPNCTPAGSGGCSGPCFALHGTSQAAGQPNHRSSCPPASCSQRADAPTTPPPLQVVCDEHGVDPTGTVSARRRPLGAAGGSGGERVTNRRLAASGGRVAPCAGPDAPSLPPRPRSRCCSTPARATCSWSASMCTSTRPPAAATCPAPCCLTWWVLPLPAPPLFELARRAGAS